MVLYCLDGREVNERSELLAGNEWPGFGLVQLQISLYTHLVAAQTRGVTDGSVVCEALWKPKLLSSFFHQGCQAMIW